MLLETHAAPDEGQAEALARVVQSLVESSACRVEPLGEDVDRHLVQRQRDENLALVRAQRPLDLLPDGDEQGVRLRFALGCWARVRYLRPGLGVDRKLASAPGS